MPLQKPPFDKRLLALFLDYLVILGWMACLAVCSLLFYLIGGNLPDYLGLLGPVGAQALFFCLLTLPVGLYLFLTESGRYHATLGKRRAGLEVVSADGNAPTKKQIAIRTVVKLLPWEIAHTFVWQMQYGFYTEGYEAAPSPWVLVGFNIANVLVIIYVLMVALRHDGRGPHDLIAGTQVVRAKDGKKRKAR